MSIRDILTNILIVSMCAGMVYIQIYHSWILVNSAISNRSSMSCYELYGMHIKSHNVFPMMHTLELNGKLAMKYTRCIKERREYNPNYTE